MRHYVVNGGDFIFKFHEKPSVFQTICFLTQSNPQGILFE